MELLGREPERAMLGEILETSHRSGGSTLVLHGTVGIGKSALLRLAEMEARQRGMSVLSVTAVPTEARLPYAGIDQLLEALAKPWATFAASVATVPNPSSQRASPGTRTFRRAESRITIELA
jgi:ABC-type nitrate/sulfonate/bicarbonate transport system ATPase subunit